MRTPIGMRSSSPSDRAAAGPKTPFRLCSTVWLTIVRSSRIFNPMVEESSQRLDAVFHALADPTRREMLRRLARKEHRVGDLAAPFQMSLAAASKHVRTLERAGLVQRTVRGRTHICRLAPVPLAHAQEWLRYYERFWSEGLDALERELRGTETAKTGKVENGG